MKKPELAINATAVVSQTSSQIKPDKLSFIEHGKSSRPPVLTLEGQILQGQTNSHLC